MNGNEIAALTQSAFTEGFKEGELYILEKLKTDINRKSATMIGIDKDIQVLEVNEVTEIIDKHIKELKGEQNDYIKDNNISSDSK